MTRRQRAMAGPVLMGIEGGGTRTVALAVDEAGNAQRIEAGPANIRLLSDAKLIILFRSFRKTLPQPTALAIGLAGALTEADRERIRRAAANVWPRVPCYATHDLEIALAAGDYQLPIANRQSPMARVLVLSGTGSCCYGQTVSGKTIKVGGWGHIIGDKGSGYEIGLRALKAVVYFYDRDGVWSKLGQRILRALQLNEPSDLIGWVQAASKAEVSALAVEVFAAWVERDKIATDILAGAAHSLARDAASCAKRLVAAGSLVQFVLTGSVLLKQPKFARLVVHGLKKLWPTAIITPLKREGAWGAVELARRQIKVQGSTFKVQGSSPAKLHNAEPVQSLSLSPTEQRNPRSLNLDKLSLAKAIQLMLSEDAKIPAAILREKRKIERAVGLIVRAFRLGGRLFYVGAGTSGRLGILDASECPPTFGTPVDQVQGIIAGGQRAIWQSVEGAEDDALAGARAIEFRRVDRNDVVVGIAASGRTPFVWGALKEAKRRGAATIFICFNPRLNIARTETPDVLIEPNIGPEILTGSTRLKAGTATKLILNIFTTLAMVRLGKVVSNLMVDLNPSNTKLRDRAVRIVQQLTGARYEVAKTALENSGWVVKSAWKALARITTGPERRHRTTASK